MRVGLYITADQDVVDLAEIIQSYLSRAGIEVVIRQLEWNAFKEAVSKGEPDLFWLREPLPYCLLQMIRMETEYAFLSLT